MPDFERLYRKLELHMADGADQRIVMAYHAGLDRARKEIAIVMCVAALTFIAIRVFTG